MRSLSSSAERRLQELRHRLVLELYMQRGDFWQRVSAIRTRWEVRAIVAVPPTLTEGPHLPASCPPRPSWEEIQENLMSPAEQAWEEFVERWRAELVQLHDAAIPGDCRYYFGPEPWDVFLSTCLLFDPPVPGLENYADAAAGPTYLIAHPGRQRRGPHYVMQQPPIAYLRDARLAEEATEDLYLGVIKHLIEKYLEPEGHDPERVLHNVLFGASEARERQEERANAFSDEKNPVRPYITVGPRTTEDDVRNAFRMIRTEQEEPAKVGSPQRNLLLNVECALLKEDGWTYEAIARRYGWPDHTRVSKHVRAGREALGR